MNKRGKCSATEKSPKTFLRPNLKKRLIHHSGGYVARLFQGLLFQGACSFLLKILSRKRSADEMTEAKIETIEISFPNQTNRIHSSYSKITNEQDNEQEVLESFENEFADIYSEDVTSIIFSLDNLNLNHHNC